MKYDIAIIGAGPGGYVAALYAAGHGKKVALIERDLLGGTCLNRGCIPTKALLSSLGKHGPCADYTSMFHKKDEVVLRLRKGIESLLKARSVDVKKGTGKFLDKGVIDVRGERVEAGAVIIATGSSPYEFGPFKFDGSKITSSAGLLILKELPRKLLIVGGGYVGCEFGFLYASLGADVTIVEMTPRLLPLMDSELSRGMEAILKKKKVKILKNTKADESMIKDFDRILISAGRQPHTQSLNLAAIGVKTDEGRISADECLKTNVEGTYAIGDVTGGKMLAHVASHEGITAVNNILGKQPARMDYGAIPACIYTTPELSTVGLTEEEAENSGAAVKSSKYPFLASGRAQASGATEGFVKIVGDAKSGQILGVHMMGAGVTELIAEATLMVKLKMKAEEAANIIHAHPTLSEALMEAAFSLSGHPIHTL